MYYTKNAAQRFVQGCGKKFQLKMCARVYACVRVGTRVLLCTGKYGSRRIILYYNFKPTTTFARTISHEHNFLHYFIILYFTPSTRVPSTARSDALVPFGLTKLQLHGR